MTKNNGDIAIAGYVAPGFEEVASEFKKNFTERKEIGASCAIYYKKEKVVDIWGGYRSAQTRQPWQEDTMTTVFSTTKGMAAIAMAIAHSRGLFELDKPIAHYWPEFAQNGKEQITVRQLLTHEAGLTAIDEPLDAAKLADLDLMAKILARQRPAWSPGSKHGYHGLSLGWFQNELMRRVDPAHRSLGRFFHEEVAQRLSIDFYIGLPQNISEERLAQLATFRPFETIFHIHKMRAKLVLSMMIPGSLTFRTFMNPKMVTPAETGNPEYRVVEFPSFGGIGNARAIARAYSAMAHGGDELGIKAATMTELTRPAQASYDALLRFDTAFAFGFSKPNGTFNFSPSQHAFGTNGTGGSFGFADPDAQLGYGYVMNRMDFYMVNDPREKALREACYRAIARMK